MCCAKVIYVVRVVHGVCCFLKVVCSVKIVKEIDKNS